MKLASSANKQNESLLRSVGPALSLQGVSVPSNIKPEYLKICAPLVQFFWTQNPIGASNFYASVTSKYKSSMPPRQVPDRCQVHKSQRGEQPPYCEGMSHQFQVSIFDQKNHVTLTLSTAKTFQNLYGYTCRVGLAMPKYSPLKPKADQVLGAVTS